MGYTVIDMIIQNDVLLAPYTSLRCGGPAAQLVECKDIDELKTVLNQERSGAVHIFGFGTNSLISDKGLDGLTIILRGGALGGEDNVLIAEAGVWWDTLINKAISLGLWGLEFTSGIPSSVGGAVLGNIAAYGQQVSDVLKWIEVYDLDTKQISKRSAHDIVFSYRKSSLQSEENIIILRAAFKLSVIPTTELKYSSALKTAEKLGLSPDTLQNRQKIILETRKNAGSLYEPSDPNAKKTAGSFFKNPLVKPDQAVEIAKFDETGKTLERLLEQNKVHGGDRLRASAAHVLLAAGFKRGQSWGAVRLHPDHILKLENTGGASAQEIYDVAKLIKQTVKDKLSIDLEPEVKFIGLFN